MGHLHVSSDNSSKDLGFSGSKSLSIIKDLFWEFQGGGVFHNWRPPANFYWEGIYPVPGSAPSAAVIASLSFPQLTLAPGQANGFFKLLTDFDLKQTAEGNPGAETITRTNLQSANAFLQNTMLHSNQYTQASPFRRPDTAHLNYSPIRTLFLKSNIALECWGQMVHQMV